jgi:hypothetical protein
LIYLTKMCEILENADFIEWELSSFGGFLLVALFIVLVLLLQLSLLGSQAAPIKDCLYYLVDELSETEGDIE